MRDRKIREEKFRLQQEIDRLEEKLIDMEEHNDMGIAHEIVRSKLVKYKTDIKNVRFKQL